MENRKCRTCDEIKGLDNYHKHNGTYRLDCKVCFRIAEKDRRLNRISKVDIEHANKILEHRKKIEERGECPHNHQWCYGCNNYKKEKDFSPYSLKNHGKCKDCGGKHDIERARIFKKRAIEHLGGKCVECGFVGHYASFEFHHENPEEKEMNWNKMRKKSWINLLPELNKCILLCSNCHGVVHCKLNDDGTVNENYVPSNR